MERSCRSFRFFRIRSTEVSPAVDPHFLWFVSDNIRYLGLESMALLEEYLGINQIFPGAFSFSEYRNLNIPEWNYVLKRAKELRKEKPSNAR